MEKQKYKILIADDEFWTREKLRQMIEWDRYSLECLEPARDGEEVLKRLEEEEPDILITDINMPFINGVEMLEIVKEKYPEIVAFVVSGYDDFEYVRGTFLSGAIHYLVKPVTKIDLVNAIVKALEIISERENEKLKLLKAASLIQDREFSQLIEKEEVPYVPNLSMNSGIELAGMSLMLIKIHNLSAVIKYNDYDMNLFSYNIKKEIHRIIHTDEIIIFNHIYRSNEFIVITELGSRELVKLAERLRIYFSKFPGTCLTFCISGHSYSMDSIHMAYVESVALLMTRTYCKKDEIILSEKKDEMNKDRRNARFTGEQEKRIQNFLKSQNAAALTKVVLEEIGLRRCEKETWGYLEVRQTVKQVMNVFADFAMQEQRHKQAVDIDSLMESADKAVESLDGEAVCEAVQNMIEYLVPDRKEAPTDTMRGIVRQAAAYIDGHYFEDLTLDSLAKAYNVENSYFSKMFRQEIGENLILYITKKRISKAKEYMAESDINLTEIAFMVGYDDYTYFSRVFKKNEGISPREYRNRHLEDEH